MCPTIPGMNTNEAYELGVKLALSRCKAAMTADELDRYTNYPLKGMGIGAGVGAGLGALGGALMRQGMKGVGAGALVGGLGGGVLGTFAPLLSPKVRAARRASQAGIDAMVASMSDDDALIDDAGVAAAQKAYDRGYRQALAREARQF